MFFLRSRYFSPVIGDLFYIFFIIILFAFWPSFFFLLIKPQILMLFCFFSPGFISFLIFDSYKKMFNYQVLKNVFEIRNSINLSCSVCFLYVASFFYFLFYPYYLDDLNKLIVYLFLLIAFLIMSFLIAPNFSVISWYIFALISPDSGLL